MRMRGLFVLLLCGLSAPVQAIDSFVNFGLVTVSTGYDDLATSIVVSSGEGANLPSSGSFNLVWYNATDYGSATSDPRREIIRCSRSVDTLTCTRAQEGTTAVTHNTSGKTYKLDATLTAKTLNIDLGTVGTPQFAGLGLGRAPSAYILDIEDAGGSGAIRAVSNGGGIAVQGLVNSGAGVAVEGISVSTTQPAVVGLSSGYYGGLFYNVTDLGSTGANANNVGIVAESVYADAAWVQQGAISGTGSTLARNNIRPALRVERVSASLGGFDFTLPLVQIEDTTASTGGLLELKANSTTFLKVNSNGNLLAKSAVVLGTTNATTITAPTCTSNCGTSPAVTGSDSFFKVVMGASGSPASGFVITFNGTWTTAPVCTVNMALTGMVVGKLPLTVVTTTTTVTVVTNGTAPATSDVYAFHCAGVS